MPDTMKTMSVKKKTKTDLNAPDLVDKGGYGGILYKLKCRSGPGRQIYCIIYEDELFIYKNHNSKDPKETLQLEYYSVENVATTTKDFRWIFLLSPIDAASKLKPYYFASASEREHKDWVSKIDTTLKHITGQEEYDYIEHQPKDISFYNPEEYSDNSNIKSTDEIPKSPRTPSFDGPKNGLVIVDTQRVPKVPSRTDEQSRTSNSSEIERYNYEEMNSNFESEDRYLSIGTVNENLHSDSTENEMCLKESPPQLPNVTRRISNTETTTENSNSAERPSNDFSSKNRLTGKYPVSLLHTKKTRVKRNTTSSSSPPDVGSLSIATKTDGYEDPAHLNATGQEYTDILPQSVYQWQLSREATEKTLQKIGAIGLYLIRKSTSDGQHVLCVHARDGCKHYIIFAKEGYRFIGQPPHPKFKNLDALIRHYMNHNLPTTPTKLSRPYQG